MFHDYDIWGTCTEFVSVASYLNLNFRGHDGAKIIGSFALNGTAASIVGLTIESPGSNAIGVITGNLHVDNSTISGSGSSVGIVMSGGGLLGLGPNVTVQNFDTGVEASWHSSVVIGEPSGAQNDLHPVVFQHNRTAINADSGASVTVLGATIIQDNDLYGIDVENGHLHMDGAPQILRNSVGIRLLDSTANVTGVQMEGNRTMAIYHSGGGHATYRNIKVSGNGRGDPTSASVHVQVGSKLDLYDSSIANNAGGGMLIAGASASRIVNTTITGNGGAGVDVRNLSFVAMSSSTITGNGGSDVACLPISEIEAPSPSSNHVGKVAWTCALSYRPGSKIKYSE